MGIITGDFDDDGLIDVFVANDSPNFHHRNKGNGASKRSALPPALP